MQNTQILDSTVQKFRYTPRYAYIHTPKPCGHYYSYGYNNYRCLYTDARKEIFIDLQIIKARS